MRTHRTLRLSSELADELTRHARETGTSFTALVERYAAEGLRRDSHPLIVFRDGPGGRRPALAGTRLDVWQVVETVKAERAVPDAAAYLSIPEAQVRACVAYYAEYKQEIDAWIDRMHGVAEREQTAWRREQSVLA